MQYIHYANGHTVIWDENVSVGQLITVDNYTGYFVLTRIDFNSPHHPVQIVESNCTEQQPPIYYFVRVLTADGVEVSHEQDRTLSASAAACRAMTKTRIELEYSIELAALGFKRSALLDFV